MTAPFMITKSEPDEHGHWGKFGGRFVPETLVAPLDELTTEFMRARGDPDFRRELNLLLRDYAGRPTPLFHARRLTTHAGGAQIYLKREDLAGQHGVATATVCALFGLRCVIYMGAEDVRRQALNVFRMRLLGADVITVNAGTRTLKDAINEALRDWVTNVHDTYYLLGSALGPHPYPLMVREFQSVIGREAREQILSATEKLPRALVACVGGGSNAIGLFHPFIADEGVRLIGVEAGGCGDSLGKHAARFHSGKKSGGGRVGVLQGTMSYVLQDANGRAEYTQASDAEALEGLRLCARLEGIIPALETAHAILPAIRLARKLSPDDAIIVNVSGRGDKDVQLVAELEGQ